MRLIIPIQAIELSFKYVKHNHAGITKADSVQVFEGTSGIDVKKVR